MRALVLTVVHTPNDARILDREIGALLTAGWQVTLAAPWSPFGASPPGQVETIDLPRATGRRRLPALRRARAALRSRAADHDVVVIHDPELLIATWGLDGLPPVIWDVHEDTASALTDKAWLPSAARPVVKRLVEVGERWAESNLHLILAEERYRERFRRDHPVIPNYPPTPEEVSNDVDDRVVYVGRLSRGRGAEELLEVGRALAPDLTLELVGWVDEPEVGARLRAADLAGDLQWSGGFVPNDEALRHVEGALAGLSLLRDEPNYRHSLPTKVLEYLSRGVPVVTTPLPAAVELVERHDCGLVVPFEDPKAAVDAVQLLRDDRSLRDEMAQRGRRAVLERYSWASVEQEFVDLITGWARGS